MWRKNVMKKFLFLLLSFLVISCEPEEVVIEEEHSDVDGFIIELNEEEVYREFAGAIVTNNLSVSIGHEINLSVHFLDNEGNEIEHSDEGHDGHDHNDEDHDDEDLPEVVVSGNDTSIAIVSTEHHEDEHEGEYMVSITGLSAGTTSFTLTLMHDGHADYTSTNPVLVTVTSDSTVASN